MVGGILLLLFIKEHCLAKKELNNSALRLKSVMKLFSWKIVQPKQGRTWNKLQQKRNMICLVDLYM